MNVWRCVIAGRPRTKNKKIGAVSASGKVHLYNPKDVEAAELSARIVVMNARPPKVFEALLARNVQFVFQIPKSRRKELKAGDWCDKKWDIGNGLKLLEDAMNGIVYLDDSQIVTGIAEKVWGDVAETRILIFDASAIESQLMPIK